MSRTATWCLLSRCGCWNLRLACETGGRLAARTERAGRPNPNEKRRWRQRGWSRPWRQTGTGEEEQSEGDHCSSAASPPRLRACGAHQDHLQDQMSQSCGVFLACCFYSSFSVLRAVFAQQQHVHMISTLLSHTCFRLSCVDNRDGPDVPLNVLPPTLALPWPGCQRSICLRAELLWYAWMLEVVCSVRSAMASVTEMAADWDIFSYCTDPIRHFCKQ